MNNGGTESANSEFDSIRGFSKPLQTVTNNSKPITDTPPIASKRLANSNGKLVETPTGPPSIVVKSYPTIVNETKGATDLLNESTSSNSASGGIYSPSNAEARRLDVASKELSASKTSLAIKAGGHKVLPTEDELKKKPVNDAFAL